jgi:hypothetical protein
VNIGAGFEISIKDLGKAHLLDPRPRRNPTYFGAAVFRTRSGATA